MTTTTKLRIRPLQRQDVEPALELMRSSLGPGSTPRTAEFWRWKHEEGPFGPSLGWVALSADRIVGLRLFLRWRFRLGDRVVEAVRAVDTATAADCRRQGVFSRLTGQALDQLSQHGCALVFNTPNRRSGAGYLKLGWRYAPRPAVHLLPLRPLSIARAAIRRPAEPIPTDLTGFAPFRDVLDAPLPLDNGRAMQTGDRLATDRSRDFLRWRYAEIPGIDYRALFAGSGADRALLVFRARLRRSLREVVLSEVMSTGPRGPELLADLVAELRQAAADYLVAAAASGSPAQALLRSLGFRRVPQGPTLATRALGADPTGDFLAGDHWHLSAGDLEIF